ncbi:MAG: hypothetical protein WAQ25_02530 [Candidatus Saccharimonas sp.]
MTTAVDAGATSFTMITTLTVGDNALRIVGIDPCTVNTYEDSMVLHYVPGATPTVQPTPGTPLTATEKERVRQVMTTFTSAGNYLQEQVNQASATQPASDLSAVLYKAMVAFDIAPAFASADVVNRMVTRTWLVTVGTSFIVLAHPLISLYHWLRYQVLRWNIHAMPQLVRHHTALVMRIIGIILVAIPFLFLH